MKKSFKKSIILISSAILLISVMVLVGTSLYFILENTIGDAHNHIGMIIFPLLMSVLLCFIVIDIISSVETESYIKPIKRGCSIKELNKEMNNYFKGKKS
jgi:hypothetical protein|tara:strand:- start:964 stop:1263 length:300 start_codon:yes stop_codon:yes gene_type:complete